MSKAVIGRRTGMLGQVCKSCVCLLFLTAGLHGQTVLKADMSLPEAPLPQAPVAGQIGSSMLTGTVADGEGAMIQDAAVVLEDVATYDKQTTVTDQSGSFRFSAVQPGLYAVTIEAKGFQPVVKTGISVHTGETYQLSQTTMQVATATTTVQVGVQTQYELAEAQLKAQEKQRFLWIVPNFYVSYVPNPAPLTAGQKIRLALRATVDPYQFINTGINAGWDQARNNYPGYGQGAAGYARRYGADYGDVVSGTIVGSGLMPALLHQDPRYFYKGTGSVPSRIVYALLAIVRTKGDNGKWQPNYSGLLGNVTAGVIANSYLPTGDKKAVGNVIGVAFEGFALRGIGTLEEEFLARWVTTHARDNGTIGHQ